VPFMACKRPGVESSRPLGSCRGLGAVRGCPMTFSRPACGGRPRAGSDTTITRGGGLARYNGRAQAVRSVPWALSDTLHQEERVRSRHPLIGRDVGAIHMDGGSCSGTARKRYEGWGHPWPGVQPPFGDDWLT
jgi:hypothetical protein